MDNEKFKIERCPTGIPGMDELLDGGFPRGRTILLSGACGTGKTIFGVEFLYNGVTKYNEPGILVMLEENVEHLKKDLMAFNFNLNEVENLGKLVIIDASLSKFNIKDADKLTSPHDDKSFSLTSRKLIETAEVVDIIVDTAKEIKAKRVVIDSLPALDNLIKNKEGVRDIMLSMNYRLQNAELTSLLIDEATDDEHKYGVKTYIVDGVIRLHYTTTGPDIGRSLVIQKMRGTKHSENIHPIRFNESHGIDVLGTEE